MGILLVTILIVIRRWSLAIASQQQQQQQQFGFGQLQPQLADSPVFRLGVALGLICWFGLLVKPGAGFWLRLGKEAGDWPRLGKEAGLLAVVASEKQVLKLQALLGRTPPHPGGY
ncbi:hypothetical protein T492DRAFT_895663 [Pavlovales sp. CCMP2436]|nr:hypothetical protein T492DRAFT_895663 [Pavlovales sp. CCMP2436]